MSKPLALVTGASSGIGREVCKLFSEKGINLILTSRDKEKLELLKDNLLPKVSVTSLTADLSRPDDRENIKNLLHEQAPSIVINNAGFGLYGEALTYTTEEQASILEVNGRAVLELTLEAARAMIAKGIKGVVLNVSSAAAFQIYPSMAVYAATKAFVNQFSQALDYEVKPHGVRVLTLCPGMVATDFQKKAGGVLDENTVGLMSPSYIAEQIWSQIERAQPLRIVDWRYRVLTVISSLFPNRWSAKLKKQIIESRIKPRKLIKK